ncbi:7071_t:CDS:1, partial [Dentiscutata heterogama]
DPQLCMALNKFSARYKAAKSQSILRLTTFLYDINRKSDSLTCIKDSKKIPVQIESVKRRKTKGTSIKRRYLKINNKNDPHSIPKYKVKKTSKKEHKLSKNILNNVLN